jgi:hypothetical protein
MEGLGRLTLERAQNPEASLKLPSCPLPCLWPHVSALGAGFYWWVGQVKGIIVFCVCGGGEYLRLP